MTTLAPTILSRAATNLTTGLTEGDTYIVQNVGGGMVEYCNFATDPADEDIGWRLCESKQFFQFEAEAANPTWARVATGTEARLSIGNG